jgi:hypothetical protein
MAIQKREAMMLVGVTIALLAGAAAWCCGWMAQQRRAAQVAAADLAECRSHAGAIKSMRERVKVTSGGEAGDMELGKRIEAALAAAQIDANSLDGIFRQAARAAGDSPYLIQPTTLPLKSVSLGQLAALLYHLTDASGLVVRDIRLQVPRGEAAQTAWDAEVTMTCLLSAPPTRTRR